MSKELRHPKSLVEAVRYFADEQRAFEYVRDLRWPNGVACPHCGCTELGFIATRRTWKCKGCKKQFSVKVGTIFEASPIKLDKWIVAAWLVANCRNGISSYELARDLDVTQKTAWFMLHRIRLAMQEGSFFLKGKVEADETFIGGKARNMHYRKRKGRNMVGGAGKTIVLGMLERGGKVVTKVIVRRDRKTLRESILNQVDGYSTLFTDAHTGYTDLRFYYQQLVVDHATEYVRGSVHTNGLENYWSLLKRTIRGTYVSVEPFHLFRYLDEQAFRFNNREVNDSERTSLVLGGIAGKRLTYRGLVQSQPAQG